MKRKIVLPNFSNYVIYPTLGKIWSKKTKKWIGRKDKKGYTVVNLQGDDDKNLATHQSRVIWFAVNGELPPKHHIHHINHNRQDDRIKNLQLISAAEHNRMHSEEKKNKPSKLDKPIAGYDKNGNLILSFRSSKEAKRNGYSCAYKCANGRIKTSANLIWKWM